MVIVRLVARALAGGDHLEAAGARPIHVLADERGLVAPGEAVDHARGLRLAREQGARDRVRLHVDHDDVLAVGDRAQRMADPGGRHARRLDDDLDLGTGHQRLGVGRHMGAPRLQRVAERSGRDRLLIPAGSGELVACACNVEIGNGDDMHAARQSRLRQKHRSELARPDQADGDGTAGGLAFEQHGMEIHGDLDVPICARAHHRVAAPAPSTEAS